MPGECPHWFFKPGLKAGNMEEHLGLSEFVSSTLIKIVTGVKSARLCENVTNA